MTKKQRGIYLFENLDGKQKYVGYSINLYNRISRTPYSTLSSPPHLIPDFLLAFVTESLRSILAFIKVKMLN